MPVRIKDGIIPYTGGQGIEITDNHVINVLLREMNNLIQVNGDRELYVDLQLPSGIKPTDTFPVGVTTGKILQADGWQQSGLILNWKTTSGDYNRLIYANDGKLYHDKGDGVWVDITSTVSSNTKTFYLEGSQDLTTAQAIYDWYTEGNMPLVYSLINTRVKLYILSITTANSISFMGVPDVFHTSLSASYSRISDYRITFTISSGTVTSISAGIGHTYVIDPECVYGVPYVPTIDCNPATKKYVDDNVLARVDSTAPSTPQAGQLRYDTANSALKIYDGNSRQTV